MGVKHTPGPWEVNEYGEHREVQQVDPDGISIAIMSAGSREDAFLMAAAADMLAVLKRYEAWEARLILDDEAWSGGIAPLPTLTQELWDELLEIQRDRNEAIGKAGQRTRKGGTS